MAGTISSVGIGTSGLNVSDIITKLVELEKAPLTKLEAQNTLITTRISAYSQMKSLSSTLSSAALNLSLSTTWKAVTTTSSDTSSVKVAASGNSTPAAGSISIAVQRLAKAQATVSDSFASGSAVGTGSLKIQLGTWNSGAFTAGSAAEVSIDIEAPDNTPAAIAAKVNAANVGVTATVITDTTGQRVMFQSTATGEQAGFRVRVDDTTTSDTGLDDGLSRLAFDPEDVQGPYGMASTANAALAQYGQNAQATVNNVVVQSTSNDFTDTVPGLKFTALKETTSAAVVTVSADTEAMTKSVQTFVDAFNALNSFIAANTKYDGDNKQATLLQGDSAAIGMQNMLRNLIGSVTTGGALERISDIGISLQQDGSLAIDSTKLSSALSTKSEAVQNLFTADNGNTQTNGFGVKLKAFMSGVLSSTGTIANRTAALEGDEKRNKDEQTKVNDRADRVQTRLEKHYTALDTKMASLTALNTYISQQITTWNKSTK